VHCPPGTDHAFVGTGDGPCVIFMTGARSENKEIVYTRSELAIPSRRRRRDRDELGAEAYAPFPKWTDGQPKTWSGLPWA